MKMPITTAVLRKITAAASASASGRNGSLLRSQFQQLPNPPNNPSTASVTTIATSFMNMHKRHNFGFSTTSSASSQSPGDEEDTSVKVDIKNDVPQDSDDDDSYLDLSNEDLLKLVKDKDQLLTTKHTDMEQMKDKFLRSYAELENVMARTKREAESSKKFAVQAFAKGLLDVADNLGRASSVVKESFSKIDTSKDTSPAVPLLNTLLEGVEMTDKQLTDVFRKFGVEKYDPVNEEFDPHRHNAVFQIPDSSKAPGIIAAVLKPGYMLYDRVIRPAEVGVTIDPESS